MGVVVFLAHAAARRAARARLAELRCPRETKSSREGEPVEQQENRR
jgi:hypothetical protein